MVKCYDAPQKLRSDFRRAGAQIGSHHTGAEME